MEEEAGRGEDLEGMEDTREPRPCKHTMWYTEELEDTVPACTGLHRSASEGLEPKGEVDACPIS